MIVCLNFGQVFYTLSLSISLCVGLFMDVATVKRVDQLKAARAFLVVSVTHYDFDGPWIKEIVFLSAEIRIYAKGRTMTQRQKSKLCQRRNCFHACVTAVTHRQGHKVWCLFFLLRSRQYNILRWGGKTLHYAHNVLSLR